ncbi:U-box domain-containing protein 36-like [Andrographis paniculata]|uniref:U-box domain-containing protein 36-like n=1 Tax=Andrographis paniculata TaxID=175694 RepID=UPI0021E70C99|nr:U-box domain-containing protein 36-like [Andrographis paniculata]
MSPSPSPDMTFGSSDTADSDEVSAEKIPAGSDGCDASEIEEEEMSEGSNGGGYGVYRMSTIREEVGTVFSYDFDGGEDAVYVAVGKQTQSEVMDALIWTVDNAVVDRSSTVVFLVHVFPETRLIPSPLGMLPISQVNQEQKEIYMSLQKAKRREFLQKFIDVCSTSKVKVDTILVENDNEVKAILNLVSVLHIRKLVLGATKSTIRKIKLRKGNTMADQILQNAPEFCDVKIICGGKEMSELAWESFTPSLSSSSSSLSRASDLSSKFDREKEQLVTEYATTCNCFKLRSNCE